MALSLSESLVGVGRAEAKAEHSRTPRSNETCILTDEENESRVGNRPTGNAQEFQKNGRSPKGTVGRASRRRVFIDLCPQYMPSEGGAFRGLSA